MLKLLSLLLLTVSLYAADTATLETLGKQATAYVTVAFKLDTKEAKQVAHNKVYTLLATYYKLHKVTIKEAYEVYTTYIWTIHTMDDIDTFSALVELEAMSLDITTL